MTATEIPVNQSTEPNTEGYHEFSLGEFHFRRDEYFVYIGWPTGSKVRVGISREWSGRRGLGPRNHQREHTSRRRPARPSKY